MPEIVINALVADRPGILDRITTLLRRRNLSLSSLAFGRGELPDLLRVTICTEGTEQATRIERNLAKLVDLVAIEVVAAEEAVRGTLSLIKVDVPEALQAELIGACQGHGARVRDRSEQSLVFELVGDADGLEQLIAALDPFTVTEVAQTGPIAVKKGHQILNRNQQHARRRHAEMGALRWSRQAARGASK